MRRVPLLSVLAALVLPGCIYITPEEAGEHNRALDEDDDGVTKGAGDCNDRDGERYPDNTEIPYDGVDQDCDELLQDVVDVDGDGYPGILPSAYAQEHPGVEWPSGVQDTDSAYDCDDAAAEVHPGATDKWYDGIDANCDLADDYDADGDGYVRDVDAENSTLPAGDCNDTLGSSESPGKTGDVWYDGIDTDCAGNNDFDADGDMYMPNVVDGVPNVEDAYAAFLSRYQGVGYGYDVFYGVDAGTGPLWDDCDDASAGMYPTATDAWYDGIDSNCDAVNDFDQDGDAYIPTEHVAGYEAWLVEYGYPRDTQGANDCDDVDDTVHPAVLETLADGVDQDCDGSGDTAPWNDAGYTWEEPRPVAVGRNDLHYILATASDATSASAYTKPGLGLLFPLDAGFDEVPTIMAWQNKYPFGETVDLVAEGDAFYVGSQYYFETSTGSQSIYLIAKYMIWKADSSSYGSSLAYHTLDVGDSGEQFYNDVDIQEDADGYWWTLGCGDQSVSVFRAEHDGSASDWDELGAGACDGDATKCAQNTGLHGDTCWLELSGGSTQAVVCTGTDCASYDVDAVAETITLSAAQPYAGMQWTSVNRSGDWLVAVQSDGTVYLSDGSASYSVFTDDAYDATYAEVAVDDAGRVYVSAVVGDEDGDGFEDVVLAYGDPSGTMTYALLPMTDADGDVWHAEHASVHVDADRVLIGATGWSDATCDTAPSCDRVAWIFFGPPA